MESGYFFEKYKSGHYIHKYFTGMKILNFLIEDDFLKKIEFPY